MNIFKTDKKTIDNSILPVYKATNYTTSSSEYRPFTQGEFYINNGNVLECDIITFTDVINGSNDILNSDFLGIGISLLNNSDAFFAICNNVTYKCFVRDIDLTECVNVRYYTGGDQQGLYWGVKFSVNLLILCKKLGIALSYDDVKFNFFGQYNFGGKNNICSYYKLDENSVFDVNSLKLVKIIDAI